MGKSAELACKEAADKYDYKVGGNIFRWIVVKSAWIRAEQERRVVPKAVYAPPGKEM